MQTEGLATAPRSGKLLFLRKMKSLLIIFCVVVSAIAETKKISLEDIERDSLKRSDKNTPPGSPTNYGFLPTKTINEYAKQPQQQKQYIQYVPQQQATVQYQPQPQYYYPHQYVAENSVVQPQYYSPQYVYVTAPSNSIQTVVDPKGGLQYIMYVPAYVTPKAEQSQTYANVVYADDQQQAYVVPEIHQSIPEAQPAPVYSRQQPKSLLDSYVPSVLQIQYYKQQQAQAQANVIPQTLKEVSGAVSGKIDYVKNSYRSTQGVHNSAESIVNYSYQENPNTYRKYSN